ncbi:hypothetical protein NUU61_000760 [Penicillium alfredii]|uniref:Peptidase S8/S53 domain-containing protein n=1 Tax=Penicillium alfredii TaxID=1506179 RepID=A0A9W9GA77_9EURO|nr:uncharacterized protein NUU61_000760 [Penicillium alfredii]KAJ5115001.1 hypothetical protein NUU61_000760 [Penicillium alfredii]
MHIRGWWTAILALTSIAHALPQPDALLDDAPDTHNATHLTKRDGPPQHNAEIYLGSISRPRKKRAKWGPPYTYDYDPSAGEGSLIYVIDSGFDIRHSEYKTLKHVPRWIMPKSWPRGWDDTLNDPTGHGTCVGSMIAGQKFGVAKNAELVIVKTAGAERIDKREYIDNYLEALEATADDIDAVLSNPGNGFNLGDIYINMSGSVKIGVFHRAWNSHDRDRLKSIMQRLNQKAMIFACTGNVRGIDFYGEFLGTLLGYPQLWYKELPNMRLVGMATQNGYRSKKTLNAPEGHLWAIAEDVLCANNKPSEPEIKKTGSSMASPQAVGLAAQLARLPNKPKGFPDPKSDFRGFVEQMEIQLYRDSWIRPESKGKTEGGHVMAVRLISNQFLNHCDDSDGCGCVIM